MKYIEGIASGRWDIPKENGTEFVHEAMCFHGEDDDLVGEMSETGDHLQYVGAKKNVEIFIGKVRNLTEKLVEEFRIENEIVADFTDNATQVQLEDAESV